MLPSRPILVIPFYAGFSYWLGGLNYVRAIIALLSDLPEDERPELVVFDDLGGDWPREVVAQWDRAGVAAAIGPGGVIVHSRDGATAAALNAIPPEQRRRILAQRANAIYPMMIGSGYALTGKHWLWLPDFQHKHLPEFFTPEEVASRDRGFAEAAARRGPLMLSSRAALDDFLRFYPDHAAQPWVWPFRSLVRPQSEVSLAEIRARHALPSRFLFIPNQFWAHKDHGTAFRALALLRAQGVDIDLVCTGNAKDHRALGYYDRLFAEVGSLGIGDRIRHLGVLPHEEVVALMQMATCIVQPSRFEGWSTVVEDALALGCPIVASDLAVHREQLPSGSLFFRTGDPADLAAVLAAALPALCNRPDRRTVQAASGAYEDLRRAAARAFLAFMQGAASPATVI